MARQTERRVAETAGPPMLWRARGALDKLYQEERSALVCLMKPRLKAFTGAAQLDKVGQATLRWRCALLGLLREQMARALMVVLRGRASWGLSNPGFSGPVGGARL